MAARRVGGGRVEEGLVSRAARHGLGEGVVDLEDGFFGAVGAVFGFVFAFDDGEGVHDVGHGMAGRGEGGEKRGLEIGDWRLGGRSGEVAAAALAPFVLAAEVEVEEGGVQLAAQQEAPILVPPERRAGPSAVFCKSLQIPSCEGKFQNTRLNELSQEF